MDLGFILGLLVIIAAICGLWSEYQDKKKKELKSKKWFLDLDNEVTRTVNKQREEQLAARSSSPRSKSKSLAQENFEKAEKFLKDHGHGK